MLVTFHVLMVLRVMDLSSDPIWRNVVASVLLKGWEADKLYLASSPMVSRTKLCPEQMLLTAFIKRTPLPSPARALISVMSSRQPQCLLSRGIMLVLGVQP